MSSRYAILIPAAPRDDVADTLDSVFHFEPAAEVVLIKDYDDNSKLDPRVTVLPPLPWKRDGLGGLLQKKMWAFEYILQNSTAEVILSLDADALLIKGGVFPKVAEVFKDENVGIAGCSRQTPSGHTRDFSPVAKSIRSRGGLRSINHNSGRRFIEKLLLQARSTEYEIGEHALGGASFFSRKIVNDWSKLGWLKDHGISKIPIPEDGAFGLMAYAAGYRIEDIGGPGGLLNIAWNGLPASPKEVHESTAYVTHSVRSFEDLNEIQIRNFFKSIRRGGNA
jgi:hypothetical protein